MSSTDALLNEFIDAWNAGGRPSVRDLLSRVPEGEERDRLAGELDAWLALAPTPRYDEASRAAIRIEPAVQRLFAAIERDAGAWPELLPSLRTRARLSVQQLAQALAQRFALPARDVDRTKTYLERMERGELEPARVSRRLLEGLGAVLGVEAVSLADAGALGRGLRPAAAGGALFRADGEPPSWVAEDLEVLGAAALQAAPASPLDDVDRLFVGGPDA